MAAPGAVTQALSTIGEKSSQQRVHGDQHPHLRQQARAIMQARRGIAMDGREAAPVFDIARPLQATTMARRPDN